MLVGAAMASRAVLGLVLIFAEHNGRSYVLFSFENSMFDDVIRRCAQTGIN